MPCFMFWKNKKHLSCLDGYRLYTLQWSTHLHALWCVVLCLKQIKRGKKHCVWSGSWSNFHASQPCTSSIRLYQSHEYRLTITFLWLMKMKCFYWSSKPNSLVVVRRHHVGCPQESCKSYMYCQWQQGPSCGQHRFSKFVFFNILKVYTIPSLPKRSDVRLQE